VASLLASLPLACGLPDCGEKKPNFRLCHLAISSEIGVSGRVRMPPGVENPGHRRLIFPGAAESMGEPQAGETVETIKEVKCVK